MLPSAMIQETGMVTTSLMTDWFIGQHGNLPSLCVRPPFPEEISPHSKKDFWSMKQGRESLLPFCPTWHEVGVVF